MSKIDIAAKQFFHNKYIISELLNITFDQDDIDPDQIHFTEENSSTDTKKSHEFDRDLLIETVLFDYKDTRICIVGLEPQSYTDNSLPIRSMVYDALEYQKQRKAFQQMHRVKKDLKGDEYLAGISKDDVFKKVITIFIWLDTKPYTGPTRLSEMMNWTEEEKRYFWDYGFIMADSHQITDAVIERCNTELREFLLAVKNGEDKDKLLELIHDTNRFRHVTPECSTLLNELLQINVIIETGKDGKVDMCKAIEEIRQEGYELGIQQGIGQGFENGKTEGKAIAFKEIAIKLLQEGKSFEYICALTGIDVSVLKTLKS